MIRQKKKSKNSQETVRQKKSQLLSTKSLQGAKRQNFLCATDCLVSVNAVPHLVWVFHRDGRFETCNQAWLDYSQLTLEENQSGHWQSRVHNEDLEQLLRKWKVAQSSPQIFTFVCRLHNEERQTYRWHKLYAAPTYDSQGELSFWTITNTDIHEQKVLESELDLAKQEAASATLAKSAFLANMSHEIRTPLGIVLGYAELLATTKLGDAPRQDYLSNIKRNGDLLTQLVGDALDLSKIEAGYLHIEKVHFSLPDFLHSVVRSFHNHATEKNICLRTELKSSIPIHIYSDPKRLRQILFNVVSNAIKFTERGEVKIQIQMLSQEPGSESLEISVKDQGVGITEEQAKKLFQPFIQVDNSTTRKYGGTGLGLSLSRQLARRLGGDVVLAASQPSGGSRFSITIGTGPLAGIPFTHIFEPNVEVTPSWRPMGSVQLQGVKVLVVDDAPENQFLLKHFLGEAGAMVVVADNGQEAVTKALSEDIDLVLMDIQMPILDGYMATQELRRRSFSKPILALTAYALKEERDRCLAAGCNVHLTKPINREELLKQVFHFSRAHFAMEQVIL